MEDLEDGKPQFSQEDFENLQAENKDLKTKVNEFRDNNLKFKQEKEEADRVARERAESERLAQEEAARTNGSIKELEDSLTNNFNQKLSEKDEMINRLVNGQIESKKTALIEEYKGKFLPQHKIAGELTPVVIHVAARSIAGQALSIFCDHSDVMSARTTGFGILGANSVQEVMDMALISQAATLEGRVPLIHFFDGFRYLLDANFPNILKIK